VTQDSEELKRSHYTSEEVPPSAVPPGELADDLIGTVYLGKYELNSVLGAGGMGVIYLGRQIFLDRPVAIKMLKNKQAPVQARTRFHQEAKAASALKHPGIVSVLDFGVDELDRPYMVMEHVEGCTISDLLNERLTLPVEDLLPVFLEICDALSEAHKKGIVHRDLKPSNIMLVVEDDGDMHIKILDFGVAKLLEADDRTFQDLTKTGVALGTPLYMSPEQILSKTVTNRSDLYSLGCMLYTCLTGAPPFIGENKIATMDMHCTDQPLSLYDASDGMEFPPGIEDIVLRLLEKNPDDRYESVDQLKEALIAMALQNGLMTRSEILPVVRWQNQFSTTGHDTSGSVSARTQSQGGRPLESTQTTSSRPGATSPGAGSQSAKSKGATADGATSQGDTSQGATSQDSRSRTTAPNNANLPGVTSQDSTGYGPPAKNSVYWKSDLSDKVKAARADKFKNLPRRADPTEDQDDNLSARVEASLNKTFLLAGTITAVILLVGSAVVWMVWKPQPKPTGPQISDTGKPTPSRIATTAGAAGDTATIAAGPIEPGAGSTATGAVGSTFDAHATGSQGSISAPDARTTSNSASTAGSIAPDVIEKTADEIIKDKYDAGAVDSSLFLKEQDGLTDKGLQLLQKFSLLRVLDLRSTGLKGESAKYLANTPVTTLMLDVNRGVSDQSVAYVAQMKSLQNLSLAATGVTDTGLKDLGRSSVIRALWLGYNKGITDQGVKNLMPDKSPLRSLFLNECNITDAAAPEILKLNWLYSLDLSDNPKVSDRTLEILQPKQNGLEFLIVANDNITDAGIHALTRYNRLRVLDLSGIRLSPKAQADLATMHGLANLYLVGCKLSPYEIDKLCKALPVTKVETSNRLKSKLL
jgi:serine/threonine protein kinase